MPNSNTIINIAPTTDITVSTLTNIFVKINAVTIYFILRNIQEPFPDFFVHLYDFKTLLQKYKE